MPASLTGVRLKLDRAEDHLDALSAELREWVEAKPQALTTQLNPIDQSYSVIFKQEPLPENWGVKLGDVVHNMRSSLDHLVAQLVLLAGKAVHENHQFPIFNKPNDWMGKVVKPPKQRKRGWLDFIDRDHVAMIEALQPYQTTTGLPSLGMLRRFSNADKHRLIHAATYNLTAKPQLGGNMTFPLAIREVVYKDPGTPLEDGTEIARFRTGDLLFPIDPVTGEAQTPSNAEMNVRADLKMTAMFGEPGKEDTRIGDFLRCLSEIRGIVDVFATDFP